MKEIKNIKNNIRCYLGKLLIFNDTYSDTNFNKCGLSIGILDDNGDGLTFIDCYALYDDYGKPYKIKDSKINYTICDYDCTFIGVPDDIHIKMWDRRVDHPYSKNIINYNDVPERVFPESWDDFVQNYQSQSESDVIHFLNIYCKDNRLIALMKLTQLSRCYNNITKTSSEYIDCIINNNITFTFNDSNACYIFESNFEHLINEVDNLFYVNSYDR